MFHKLCGQSHRTVSINTFLKRKESRSGSNRGPSVYQPSALPLGHTGSHPLASVYSFIYHSYCHSARLRRVQVIPDQLNDRQCDRFGCVRLASESAGMRSWRHFRFVVPMVIGNLRFRPSLTAFVLAGSLVRNVQIDSQHSTDSSRASFVSFFLYDAAMNSIIGNFVVVKLVLIKQIHRAHVFSLSERNL